MANSSETINVLLTIPVELNAKLCAEAGREKRSRHAQMLIALEKYFETAPNGRKETKK